MRLYLDTSALVPLHIHEPTSASVTALIESGSATLISDWTVAEFGSALSGRVRQGSLTVDQATDVFRAFDQITLHTVDLVEIVSADIRQAGRMARLTTPALRVPDGIHIAACLRLGATLVSSDQGQLAAARFHGLSAVEPART